MMVGLEHTVVSEKSKKNLSKYLNLTLFVCIIMITRRNKLYLIGFAVVAIIFIVRFLG